MTSTHAKAAVFSFSFCPPAEETARPRQRACHHVVGTLARLAILLTPINSTNSASTATSHQPDHPRRFRHPRANTGILVAITVTNWMLASGGSEAIRHLPSSPVHHNATAAAIATHNNQQHHGVHTRKEQRARPQNATTGMRRRRAKSRVQCTRNPSPPSSWSSSLPSPSAAAPPSSSPRATHNPAKNTHTVRATSRASNNGSVE